MRLRVSVPDVSGSLAKVAAMIAEAGGNIVDVTHQRAFSKLSVKLADVDFTIETRTSEHAERNRGCACGRQVRGHPAGRRQQRGIVRYRIIFFAFPLILVYDPML